ncbi:dermonecrotic toxin domain-containing protein [Pseudomonas cremoricolorata]|uniref:Dermonecrotic toxin N-terminal domain-containing protein n=1 Tax=Pseudomonas cremoricolorata TaxID=157783 RepID=A0A089WGN0_9PSED|nr:DUF6543 domain-containing protein [Pseudomonas cremoricolorata]AIR88460.1 hypothetical protein LK03_03985 [Pseudomonas cremoricolorata]
MSLEQFKAFDLQLSQLLDAPPQPDPTLPLPRARQNYFAALTDYWLADPDGTGNRRQRLGSILRQQLLAQIDLRIGDHTLGSGHADLLRACLTSPLPAQRQQTPAAQRPQVYRPLLDITTPHWRSPLRGAFVIVEGGPEGSMADPGQPSEYALLYSLSHGIETFHDLAELHLELFERLDDPQQSRPLLHLLDSPADREKAHNAERLRYDWFNDDLIHAQAQAVIDAQYHALTQAWNTAAEQPALDWPALQDQLRRTADLLPWLDSRCALQTRYGLLLERNSPAWLKNASAQGLTHIMQTMQELVIAIDRAAAPGILSLAQFAERESLLAWTCDRLRSELRQRHQLDLDPQAVYVSVTLARQRGPVTHPGVTTGWIPVAARPQVGDTIELVRQTYRLDELALLNISLLDIDYWLTARVHDKDDNTLTGISPSQVKQMVRALNVGDSYSHYLRKHLLTSLEAQWRREHYEAISCARMRAEVVKARYAGHFLEDPFERGFAWATLVIDHPDSQTRESLDAPKLSVRQLLIAGHTLHDVMLITPDAPTSTRLLAYTPDAPDRRAWREFRNARHLLRTLREKPHLREYVQDRLPMLERDQVERWLTKGGLGAIAQRPVISGDFQQARYRAEVNALIAAVDASTYTRLELLGEFSLHAFSVLLDLVSLVLPARGLTALAVARALLSVIDTEKAFGKDDRVGVLKHLVEAFTHANDAVNSIGGTTVIRRAIRAIPPTPPLKLPTSAAVRVNTDRLHYRVDGIHKEGIYEQRSPYPGLSLYFIRDASGTNYQVAFDGYRWRVVDPRMPDAYIKVPVMRCANGEWVVDSPVLWFDGLPDLQALFDHCRLSAVPTEGQAQSADGLFQLDEQVYLRAGAHALPLRKHLLDDHYHLLIPRQSPQGATAWAILRWHNDQWRVRVRQPGRSSDWLALPQAYAVRRGNAASSR